MRRLALLSASLLLGTSLAAAQTVTWNPDTCDFVLDPGELQEVFVTACLPGVESKADIYLLADTTQSMTPILNQLKTDAVQIVSTLLATPDVDIRVGLGQYRDFFNLPCPPQPFVHQVDPTTNQADIVAGINTWFADCGGDGSEAQFYALYRLATDNSIPWRPDAKRIIVWFGDSPGHDPICDVLVGFGVPTFPIDEALLTAALQSAGPGGATIVAIGTPTSQLVYPNALNSDPALFAEDYAFFCQPGGLPGQASRLAAATNGVSTQVATPGDITDAILGSVESVLTFADVTLDVLGDIGPFVQSIAPASHEDVRLPTDPDEEVCVDFLVTLVGPPCADQVFLYQGALQLAVNGTPVSEHPVSITQPSCYTPSSLLVLGIRRDASNQPFENGGPEDVKLVTITMSIPGQGTVFPALAIPNNAAIVGFEGYAQCMLLDQLTFPLDPFKTSNGLVFKLGANNLGIPYGAGSGLSLQLAHPALLGGTLEMDCTLAP